MRYHGGEDALLDLEPLGQRLLLDLVDGVEVEPLRLGRDEDVLVVIGLAVGDVGVDGEVLLCELCVETGLLLGAEEDLSLRGLVMGLLISLSPSSRE